LIHARCRSHAAHFGRCPKTKIQFEDCVVPSRHRLGPRRGGLNCASTLRKRLRAFPYSRGQRRRGGRALRWRSITPTAHHVRGETAVEAASYPWMLADSDVARRAARWLNVGGARGCRPPARTFPHRGAALDRKALFQRSALPRRRFRAADSWSGYVRQPRISESSDGTARRASRRIGEGPERVAIGCDSPRGALAICSTMSLPLE